MSDKILKYFLFILLAGSIFLLPFYLPFLQKTNPPIQAKKLSGTFKKVAHPTLYPRTWLDKSFQKNMEQNLKQESPITPFFVRGKNQLDYQVFNHINTNKTLAGKDGFLYSNGYCETYIGKDFIGLKKIEDKISKLKMVCDSLKNYGVQCLVINPPGKPRARPEFLPDFYQDYPKESTNWEVFKTILNEAEIPNLDLDFLLHPYQNEGSEIELYPTLGLHWNYLGVTLMAEKLRDFAQNELDIWMPKMNWKIEYRESENMLGTDLEMMYGANLLKNLPSEVMPYPIIEFEKDSLQKRPNVLTIADSYYKIFYDYGIQKGLFDPKSDFFYYYRERFPKRKGNPRSLEVLKALEGKDLLILSHAEVNLDEFGFGFLKRLYDKFKD